MESEIHPINPCRNAPTPPPRRMNRDREAAVFGRKKRAAEAALEIVPFGQAYLPALGALPKAANCSLPTKPNFVTPELLMMFSTRAESS